jgi:hypothetical protein
MTHVERFKLSDAGYQPFVRDNDGRLAQVHAAPQWGAPEAFLSAPELEVGIVGNRGGSKTHTLLLDALSGIGRGWGSNYSAVLLRPSLRQMTDLTTMSEQIIRPIWGNQASYHRLWHIWEWRSGEKLEFNYLSDLSEFGLYQGKNFSWVGWEELALQPNLEAYLAMFSTLRSPLPEHVMPRKVRFTANPGGPSHNAIKFRFRLSGIPQGMCGPCIVDENGQTRRIIHSTFDDNRLLKRTEPNYMSAIETACEGNPAQLQSWRYGNWDITAHWPVVHVL